MNKIASIEEGGHAVAKDAGSQRRKRSIAGELFERILPVFKPSDHVTDLKKMNVIKAMITWDWLMVGDIAPGEELKCQVKDEMTNIGLLAALILTVVVSFLIAALDLPSETTEWELGVFACIWFASVLFMGMAVIKSVILLLAMNETVGPDEATRLMKHLGTAILLPARLFFVGMVLSVFGMVWWSVLVFPLKANIVIAVLVVVIVGFINFPVYYVIVGALIKTKRESQGRNSVKTEGHAHQELTIIEQNEIDSDSTTSCTSGGVSLNDEELVGLFDAYLESLAEDVEKATPENFQLFICKTRSSPVTYASGRRAHQIFQRLLDARIAESIVLGPA